MNSINIQGNILTYDIIERIATDQEVNQAPKDYGFQNKSEILSELEITWGVLKSMYNGFRQRAEALEDKDTGVTETRKMWMVPFFSQLGYDLHLNKVAEEINDRKYKISHKDEDLGGYPIHIIGANQSLDKKYTGMRMSSHALIQEYLNHHDNLYALVTNGRQLRLLRDSQLLTKISYVEFDLDKMFQEDQFSDFVMLWKLLHTSRMPQKPELGPESIIEQYHSSGLESGSRIREKLSLAVKEGITVLGNGLLQEEQNEALRSWLGDGGTEKAAAYYEEILRMIYRVLFIMVIEERDLIYPYQRDEAGNRTLSPELLKLKDIYYSFYSLRRLRELSLRQYYGNDQHYDLWQYMINVFTLYETNKGKKLGIQALAGDLFSTRSIEHLRNCQLNNDVLLKVFRGLSVFENKEGQYLPVNYRSLDVEEFGSVYEGLLELDAALDVPAQRFSFVKGEKRSTSGSHYTPDELVQPLIKHSLEHLITDIFDEQIDDEDKINRLLSLTVCDVACGSGHILLAAARRIGLEVARLRSGEEQPNPEENRMGVRDAIKHCIYGVDRNPLAVELCKVAMWLEAHVPGEPLNFLDHKIKNGDAIVGLSRMEELYNGIATEAFKAYKDEEKENVKLLKKSNNKQRKDREAGQLRTQNVSQIIEDKLGKYKERFTDFNTLPERTVEEIETKQKAYNKLISGSSWWFVKNIADLQIAQFFVDKSEIANVVTDDDYFDIIAGRKTQTKAETMAMAEATERKFFHWFLEFPEVFAKGGFSCVLGNPPYIASRDINKKVGARTHSFIKVYYVETSGKPDLISFFVRRIGNIVTDFGFMSCISTNSISQGDSRIASLEFLILKNRWDLNMVKKNIVWPGKANTTVSLFSFFKGAYTGNKFIDNQEVDTINSRFEAAKEISPVVLIQNKGNAFQGSILGDEGFKIESEFALSLDDSRMTEVVFPFLTGNDLNDKYDKKASNKVIDFQKINNPSSDQYPELFKYLRSSLKSATLNKVKWYLHHRDRRANYKRIRQRSYALINAIVSKYPSISRYHPETVFSNKNTVFIVSKEIELILNSSIYNEWVYRFMTTMGSSTISYSIGICFDSYPFNTLENMDCSCLENYIKARNYIQSEYKLSLTRTYNTFHNPFYSEKEIRLDTEGEISAAQPLSSKNTLVTYLEKNKIVTPYNEILKKIDSFRFLQSKIDLEVLEAYGWHQQSKRWGPAIALRHDFYEVDYLPENDRVRYTIHPDARREVLKRLLLLNHEVHESEERGITYAELDKEKTLDLMRDHFQKEWNLDASYLQPGTLRHLTAGEELIPSLATSTAQIYNSVVNAYGSAIESELQEKLFIPFTDHIWEKYDEQDLKDLTFKEKEIREVSTLANKLFRKQSDYMMGQIHYLLTQLDDTSSPAMKQSKLLKEFRDFFFYVYKRPIVQEPFLGRFKAFLDDYRNEAAHTGQLTKSDAEQCRQDVMWLVMEMVGAEY